MNEKTRTLGSADVSRPQPLIQSDLQPRDGSGVGPTSTSKDGSQGGPVDSGLFGNASNASIANHANQGDDELPGDFGDRVVAGRRRPVDTQLRWGDTSGARRHVESLAPAVGRFAEAAVSDLSDVLQCCSYSQLSDEVLTALKTYRPQKTDEWDALKEFVTDACSLAAPATAYTAKLLMTVTTPFVVWCVYEQGWPMQADVVFSRQAINQYCTEENKARSEGTRRNYRAMLTRISEVVAPEEHPDKYDGLARKRTATPYTDKEIAGFRTWALGQLTPEKRRKAMLMLVLCTGAGLKSSDIAQIFPEDVTADEAGIVISIKGRAPRRVPLARDWEDWFFALLQQSEPGVPLWGTPNRTNASNLLSSFTQYTVGKKPNSQQLRATWIVNHLRAGTRVKELMKALGQDKFENLPRYLEFVDSLDDTEYRRQLRDGGAR
ncbi:hypothetical protein SAMN04489806_1024 [Paramicrobacterium humi]|uniref:Phage integrase family protein n=1 Tax=Paramicrobacterium humi TaxID=640635 RepID=A0A1H4K6W1_9MICO|nr:site-specific integrase [Microbacterium humi]SEB53865.1 hypothetical protein SAMN04489806_1024 [Microbacterium humi]